GMAGHNPLLGPNDERFGPRFPAVAQAYDVRLRRLAHQVANDWRKLGVTLHEGVYTMVAGPNFETKAELRFLRIIGTDAVGMSTVGEVIVYQNMGVCVLGVSLVTNTATGEETEEVKHSDVISVARAARSKFMALVREIVREIEFPSGTPID